MAYKRVELNYNYDDLEPYIDKETMKIHYENHHKGYETKLNELLNGTVYEKKFNMLLDLMKNYQEIEEPDLRVKVRQFGGGLINHNFFFAHLKKGTTLKDGNLKKAIIDKYGSVEEMMKQFEEKSLSLFGSGWTYLVVTKTGELKIIMTFNQDNPWFLGFKPIFCLDVWEHAYYLKHNSARDIYIKDFWNVLDWEKAKENFETLKNS